MLIQKALTRLQLLLFYQNIDKINGFLGLMKEDDLKKSMNKAAMYRYSNTKVDFVFCVTKDFTTEYYS